MLRQGSMKSFARMSRKLSTAYTRRFENIRDTHLASALDSLVACVLYFLASQKDHMEYLDDEMFELQLKSNHVDHVYALQQRCRRLTELFSVLLLSLQRKLEEMSVVETLTKMEEAVMDRGVCRRPEQTVADEVSAFLAVGVFGSPLFEQTFLELLPQPSRDLVRAVCDPRDDISRAVCIFVARYHCASARDSLPSPNSLTEQITQMCFDRRIHFDVLSLEKMIFPFVLSICRDRTNKSQEDARFCEQCAMVGKATQSHFSIRLDLQCKGTTVPWEEAIHQLETLRFYYAPHEMLLCVFEMSKRIFETSNRILGEAIGGDDFMDVLCYVVFKAKLPNLNSLVHYMVTFSTSDDSEMGYYFTCLQLALSFIRDVNWSHLNNAANQIRAKTLNGQKKFPRVFLIAERELFTKKYVPNVFEVVAPHVPLTGFVLYAVREWIEDVDRDVEFDKSNFEYRKCIAVRTKRNTDVIHVCAVRLADGQSEDVLTETCMKSMPEIEDLKMVDTRFGVIQCIELVDAVTADMPASMRFGLEELMGMQVQAGNFDDVAGGFKDFGCARKLLWTKLEKEFASSLSPEVAEMLQKEYGLDTSKFHPTDLVREAQVLLKLLACYPRLAPLNGLLTSQTTASLCRFQKGFAGVPSSKEESRSAPDDDSECSHTQRLWRLRKDSPAIESLSASGRLNPETLCALFSQVRFLVGLLQKHLPEGQVLPSDEVVEFAKISSLLKSFQERNKVFISGSFDDATLSILLQDFSSTTPR